jgi:hypothetical protein
MRNMNILENTVWISPKLLWSNASACSQLKGHFQRFFDHESHLGHRYHAAEFSVGCPGGFSGAPVFNPEFQGRLVISPIPRDEINRRAQNQHLWNQRHKAR